MAVGKSVKAGLFTVWELERNRVEGPLKEQGSEEGLGAVTPANPGSEESPTLGLHVLPRA